MDSTGPFVKLAIAGNWGTPMGLLRCALLSVVFCVAGCGDSELDAKLRGTEQGMRDGAATMRSMTDLNAQLAASERGAQTVAEANATRIYIRDLVAHWDATNACANQSGWGHSVFGEGGPCPTWKAQTEVLSERNQDYLVRLNLLSCSVFDLQLAGVMMATREEAPNDTAQLALISENFEGCRRAVN